MRIQQGSTQPNKKNLKDRRSYGSKISLARVNGKARNCDRSSRHILNFSPAFLSNRTYPQLVRSNQKSESPVDDRSSPRGESHYATGISYTTIARGANSTSEAFLPLAQKPAELAKATIVDAGSPRGKRSRPRQTRRWTGRWGSVVRHSSKSHASDREKNIAFSSKIEGMAQRDGSSRWLGGFKGANRRMGEDDEG